jgi:hypothetical protein
LFCASQIQNGVFSVIITSSFDLSPNAYFKLTVKLNFFQDKSRK